jgi:hypothetical protein
MSIHFTRTSWILGYAMAALHDDFTSTASFDDAVIAGRYAAEEQGVRRGPLPIFWKSPQVVYEADEWESAEDELADRTIDADAEFIELDVDDDEAALDRAQLEFNIESLARRVFAALDAEDAKISSEAELLLPGVDPELRLIITRSEATSEAIRLQKAAIWAELDRQSAANEAANREALSRAFALPQFGQQQWEMDGQGWEHPVVQSGNVAGGDIVGGNVYAYTPEPGEQALGYPVTGVIRDDGSIEHDSRGPGAEQRNFNRYVESQKGLAFSSGPVVDPFPTQAAPCTCPVCTRGL